MAIHKFVRLLAAGQEIVQYGDGSSARDYTYVADIVDGIVRSMRCCTAYHIWNLGGSHTIKLGELIQELARGLGVPARVRQLPMQPGDVERTWADVSKAERELEWRPRVETKSGLEAFIRWFQGQPETPASGRRTE